MIRSDLSYPSIRTNPRISVNKLANSTFHEFNMNPVNLKNKISITKRKETLRSQCDVEYLK